MIKNSTHLSTLNNLVYLGCIATLFATMFDSSIARSTLLFSSVMALLAIIFQFNEFKAKKDTWLLPIAILALGIANLAWVAVYKQPETAYSHVYRAYSDVGKILIMASFIFLFALNKSISNNNILKALSITVLVLQLILAGTAFYQSFYLGAPRIELFFKTATGGAYVLSVISLLALQASLLIGGKYKYALYIISFIIGFVAILLTQTRAAILVFPIISILLFINELRKEQRSIKTTLALLCVLFIASLFIFSSIIEKRTNQLLKDIRLYSQSNSHSSIGGRFAMGAVGIQSGQQALMGQSVEQRAEKIKALIKENPTYSGAQGALNVHMHNDLIDNFSLKGIWGALLVAFIYLSLIYTAFRVTHSVFLFAMTCSVILYGFSDIIFFAKDTPTVCIMSLIACILLNYKNKKQSINNKLES